MGIICLFFPASIYCALRHKVNYKVCEWNIKQMLYLLLEYICGNIMINWLIMCSRWLIKGNSGNVYTEIINRNDFAVKYLFLAVALAIILVFVEQYVKNRISINCNSVSVKFSNFQKRVIVIFFALFYAGHNFIRMLDGSVWGDEAIVVNFARESWGRMLERVAEYGHSPFHYVVAWIFRRLFGESGIVFHLSATLPYFIILILAITIISKWFGYKASIILMTLASLLECAVKYNLEIRMYTWCELFIFVAYLMLYQIYKTQKIRYYILMMLSSIAAVYTHYFALASIGIMYFVLFVYVCLKNRKRIVPVILSGGAVLAALVPWLVFAKNTVGTIISDYRIGQIALRTCVEYIFSSKYSMPLLFCFFVVIFIWFLYSSNILKWENVDGKKNVLNIQLNNSIKLSSEWLWILSGMLGVFGTIVFAEIYSHLMYPIICLRYLYVSYILVWFLMSIGISKLKLGRLWTLLLVFVIFISCYPSLLEDTKSELHNNRRLKKTLEQTQSRIDEDDVIYTDDAYFSWTIEGAYYPGTKNILVGQTHMWGVADLSNLDPNTQYWLFLTKPISKDYIDSLTEQKMVANLVVNQGYIGTRDMWIYKVVNVQ